MNFKKLGQQIDEWMLENAQILLIDGDRGANYPKQHEFQQVGYCLFLSAKNVTSSGFIFENPIFISQQKDEKLRGGKLVRGDIVVTTRGTIGNVAYYDDSVLYENIRINSGMMIFRADETVWNRRFLYFVLVSIVVQNQIKGLTSGSAVPQLPARDLKKFVLPKVSKDIQNKVVKILGDLNDKIAINQQINQTLESMAQTLFKSWFIDFDPVKAKMAGRVPKGMDADLLALFPDSFEDSELGQIPKGWEVKEIEDIGVVITGKTPSTKNAKYFGNQYPFIKIPNMNSVWVTDTNTCLSESGHQTQSKKLLPKGAVVVSCIASPGLVAIVSEPSHTNQQINAVIPKNNYPTSWLFCALINLRTNIIAMASGGSVNLNLNKNDFSHIKVRQPDNAVMKAFEQIAGKLFDKILTNEIENKALAETRDNLLPKLLSGEISVANINSEE